MSNPDTSPASAYIPSFETAARSLKVVPIIAPVHSDAEIETTIIALGREPGGGLVVIADAFGEKLGLRLDWRAEKLSYGLPVKRSALSLRS